MEYASGLPERMDIGYAIAERSTEDAVQYLRDLARGMADGETMDLRVPDFDHTVAIYANHSGGAEQHALAGGRFKSIWNRTKLVRALDACGTGVGNLMDRGRRDPSPRTEVRAPDAAAPDEGQRRDHVAPTHRVDDDHGMSARIRGEPGD